MAQYGLTQIIHEATHIRESSVSCTDLILFSQENLVTNWRVNSSLHPHCHHQIVFSNFNLKIHYPPPYERLNWKYEKANADLIKRDIKDFDWENKSFLIDINDQVVLFNETIVNIMSNLIPNESMAFDDRDPIWLNKNIKNMIKYKIAIYNKLIRHNDSNLQLHLRYFQNLLNTKIEQAERKYFENISHKLSNIDLHSKKY